MDLLQAARARGEAQAYVDVGLEKEAFVGAALGGAARGLGWLGRQAGLWGTKSWQLGTRGGPGLGGLTPTLRTGGQYKGWWDNKSKLGKGLTVGGFGAAGTAYGGSKLMEAANTAEQGAQRFRDPHYTQIYGSY